MLMLIDIMSDLWLDNEESCPIMLPKLILAGGLMLMLIDMMINLPMIKLSKF